ncbi:MAG: hypothetical protein Q9159_007707, partial [Coniocarpon cinnabarinum]
IPRALLELIHATYNAEILDGNTYPMLDPLPALDFRNYWFGVFGAVMLLGTASENTKLIRKSFEKSGSFTPEEWEGLFIGTFYVKPNYPGRSSHVCNAGFLVAPPFRGSGGGRRMGECYLDWAPRLGYTYSVFNLVYESNVASVRIWEGLGFERIGRVPECGNLKGEAESRIAAITDSLTDVIVLTMPAGFKGKYVDAIVFGKKLGDCNERTLQDARTDQATVQGVS